MVPASLIVAIGDVPVGRLRGDRRGATEFRFLDSYRDMYPSPILGQYFVDRPDETFKTRQRLPPWFSNLLPEGALRELIARGAHAAKTNEYALLHRIRDDLPGNVRLLDDEAEGEAADIDHGQDAPERDERAVPAPWKFSLAGMQLKFSVSRVGERGLTVPVSGTGGDWIAKLPDPRFQEVPANEFATMSWARASGIDVPEFELIDMAKIDGLAHVHQPLRETKAFVIRRFDRPARDQRVHVEDFAQIMGVYPDLKYDKASYETVAKLVLASTPEASFRQFVRRLVFVVASGNADAHLKNWSLIYRDGVRAELSPAYDLVSTIQYMAPDALALSLAKSKAWADVSPATFERMARKLDVERARLLVMVDEAKDAILAAWSASSADFGYTQAQRAVIEAHLTAVPLFRR